MPRSIIADMARRLPSAEEAAAILAARRTRPVPRPPPLAGRALRGFVKSLDDRFGATPAALQARWREIAGESLAKVTQPMKVTRPRGGGGAVLELRVAGAFAPLIQHQGPEILAKVNLVMGPGAVEKLRIVQGPVKAAAPTPATTRAARRRRPLDAAVEQSLSESVAGARDDALRKALAELGREVLRTRGE